MFNIQREKKNQDYQRYLEALLEYLYNYLLRVKPLINIDNEIDFAIKEFEKKWLDGTFPGWPVKKLTLVILK